jgi:hypothetical protein
MSDAKKKYETLFSVPVLNLIADTREPSRGMWYARYPSYLC